MTRDLVRRLLGPDRTPLSCEQCFEELDRYVESRLAASPDMFESCSTCDSRADCSSAQDCLAIRAHLESCAACKEEYASLRDLLMAEHIR